MVIYYQNNDIWVIDDAGNPRRLAWNEDGNSLESNLRAWVISGSYLVSDSGQVSWPDKSTGTLTVEGNYDKLTYPGYIIKFAHDRKSLPEVLTDD
jgi:hypothetical protein